MEPKKYESQRLADKERKLSIYPNKRIRNLVVAYSHDMEQSISEAGNDIFKMFFEKQPDLVERLQRIIQQNPQIVQKKK